MELRNYTAAFEAFMLLIMFVWDRILIERLWARLAAMEKDIHKNAQGRQESRDQNAPMGRQPAADPPKNPGE